MVKPKENPQVSVISQEGTDWMNKVDSLLRIVLLVSLYQGFYLFVRELLCFAELKIKKLRKGLPRPIWFKHQKKNFT